jgi:hypothetical protein
MIGRSRERLARLGFVGFLASFVIRTSIEMDRYQRHGAARYEQGQREGVHAMQREGHGRWTGNGAPPHAFEWLPVQTSYNGDRTGETIPGLSP